MTLYFILAKPMIYAQDFEVSLSSLAEQSDTVCIGDTLKFQINVGYNGTTLDLSSATLKYYTGEVSEITEPFYTHDIFWDTPITLEEGSIVLDDTTCLEIIDNFQLGENTITVQFLSDLEGIDSENDTSTIDVTVNCIYADFEGVLDSLAPEQDTLFCDTDSLYLNAGVRYNGAETITVDTLYLNYGINQDSIVHQEIFYNETFEPGQVMFRSHNISTFNPVFNAGAHNLVLIWPTANKMFLDTTPENDFTIDSTFLGCQYVDFEGILEPLAPDQDTLLLYCDSLYLNAGVRYNGTETITVDTLYLNYGINNDSQIVHQDTLYDETFEPGDTMFRSYNMATLNPPFTLGHNLVLIWPTVSRMFLDTTPENDFAIDSTYLLGGCYESDLGIRWEEIFLDRDTICDKPDTLYLDFSIYYSGAETRLLDTLILNYYIGDPVGGGTLPMPVYQDTIIYGDMLQLGDTLEFSEIIEVVDPLFTPDSENSILVWLETPIDQNPNNNVLSESVSVGCAPKLPLDLLSFIGSYVNDKVWLQWKVDSWIEGDHFEIQRSENGLNFDIIGRVDALANGQLNTYQFEDSSPYFLSGYYRLKMIDIKGVVKYSPVLILKKDDRSALDIESVYIDRHYKLNVIYASPDDYTPYALSIYDVTGRLIYQEAITETQFGFNNKQIDLRGLISGIYILSIQSDNAIISTKFKR